MPAQYLTIDARNRRGGGFLVGIEDFTVRAGESVDARIVLTSPNISLLCFDDLTNRAIFVELPLDVDLSTAPFVYQMQFERAQRLIAMPNETFRQLAHELPAVSHLIPMYITGRSGSTLVSHVFNALDDVLSLSEPDVATQFVHLQKTNGAGEADLRDLLDCTIRMLFKPTPFKSPTTYAVKFRNEATRVMDLYQATFPHAKNLYLHRDAVGFVRSFYRLFKGAGSPPMLVGEFVAFFDQMMDFDLTPFTIYLDPGTEIISLPVQLTLWWMCVVESYLKQYAKGIPVLAVNYADLNSKRERVVSAILDYCGLPKERAAETMRVFERDAQAGTFLARENPAEGNKFQLTEAEHDEVVRILARHPVIKESDFILPGTLTV